MKTHEQIQHYAFFGPTLQDSLEALLQERQRYQDCIEALTRCKEMGLLGCCHPSQSSAQPEDIQG